MLANALALWTVATAAPATAEVKVMVTIKPLHALVSQVMAGAGAPGLLVDGSVSPHSYALKPSDAARLGHADVFFRMSEAMEPFTVKIAKSLPQRVQVITLQDTQGLQLYPRRTSATFEGPHDHSADADHDHGRDGVDGHAWLDPVNAKVLVDRIAQVLSARDPADAARFNGNAVAVKARLDALAEELNRELAPVAGKPYVVVHDALQYFERRFGLRAVGSISVSPEIPPGARRLATLRKKISSLGATCVFAEPQLDGRLVNNVVEGTRARIGSIDPEGLKIPPGSDLYLILLRNLAQDLKGCLAPPA